MGRFTAVLVALALAASACGDASGTGVASLRAGDQTAAAEDLDARRRAEDALLVFAQCMRGEGIDVPDPVFNEDGTLQFDQTDFLDEYEPEEILEARDACAEHLEGVTLAGLGIDRTAIEDALFEYAVCMRDQGFDMPDPDLAGFLRRALGPPDDQQVDPAAMGPFGAIDIEDPEFLAADEVCRPRAFGGFGDLADDPPGQFGNDGP